MPASPKSSRQSPVPNVESYTLYYVVEDSVGLTPFTDTQMIKLPVNGSEQAGEGGEDDAFGIIDIGFEFSFDNQKYRQVHVNTNGFMTIDQSDELDLLGWQQLSFLNGSEWRNDYIRMDMTTDHVLLAPWFDDLRNVYDRKNSSDPDGWPGNPNLGMTTTEVKNLNYGLWRPASEYRPLQAGIKYFRDNASPLGRRLIIRWTSITDYQATLATSIIRFEAVLYENGRIEFRYSPRDDIKLITGTNDREDATIGIFGNITGKNRYRDFSRELDVFVERQRYTLGGAIYDASFSDDTRTPDKLATQYVSSLKPEIHWPGQQGRGAMFVFQPPVRRRKILPRRFIKGLDSLSRYPKFSRTGDANRWQPEINQFDDRRTLIITSGASNIVNYPVKLPRDFGGNRLSTQTRRDIYEGGFEASGSTQGAFDVFRFGSSVENFVPIAPFSEEGNEGLIINDNELSFFATGSNPDDLGSFDQPIWSKTQLKLEFPINYTTRLFENTSSILYYNARYGQFYVKGTDFSFNSSGEVTSLDKTDNCNVRETYTNRLACPEDYRGFGPFGNLVVSGSATTLLTSGSSGNVADQTNSNVNDLFDGRTYTDALTTEYGKSVSVNVEYDALREETFTLPIAQPFLIEKAIIEIPIEAGPSWFNDKTRLFHPLGAYDVQNSYVDAGGPAVTVALFNQLRFGETRRRDLILSATFTHTNDSGSNVVFENFPGLQGSNAQMYPEGFDGIAGRASAYVTPGSGSYFTGSVRMLTKAQVSNGIFATLRVDAQNAAAATNRQIVRDFLVKPKIKIKNGLDSLGSNPEGTGSIFRNNWINNFGRSQTGFEPAGQSIFGREHKTFGDVDSISNTFFQGSSLDSATEATITANDSFIITYPVNLLAYKDSPYLVFPNQQLVLAVSKARPRVYTTWQVSNDPDDFFNEEEHDIKIPSGSNVRITLFGSLIKENKEFHDTLNQPLDSEGIHEIICDEPILDQFEVVDRRIYSGTYDDGFMTGTMFTTNPKYARTGETDVFTIGKRQVAFSRTTATKDRGFDISSKKSQRLTEQYEVANSLRTVRHISDDETYWDSLVPDPRSCAIRNGSLLGLDEVYKNAGAVWVWNFRKHWDTLSDNRWTWSFPFEPHYNGIRRLDNIVSAYSVKYGINISADTSFQLDTNVPVRGISVWAGGLWKFPFFNEEFGVFGRWFADYLGNEFLSGTTTGIRPLEDEEALQVIYGFGDRNVYTGAADDLANGYKRPDIQYFNGIPPTAAQDVCGHNQSPNYRQRFNDNLYTMCLHPEIRGWKYGLLSGIPTNSSIVYRRNKFGQHRDMIEQRPFAKFYGSLQGVGQSSGFTPPLKRFFRSRFRSISTKFPRPGPVYVRFINPITGRLTSPDNTWSSNLHFEATSSLPFIDGISTNRSDINVDALNQSITTFTTDENNNLTV